MQVIDGKARLVREDYCDGLGACIGDCPRDAIHVEERESLPYDEYSVIKNIAVQGEETLRLHLDHLEEHGEKELLSVAKRYMDEKGIHIEQGRKPSLRVMQPQGGGCPGSAARVIQPGTAGKNPQSGTKATVSVQSRLRQWPVQLKLLNLAAPCFTDCHLLVAADCVPFASGDFHDRYLKGKSVAIFCPKLDSGLDGYVNKLAEIFIGNTVHSVKVLSMEVPCCKDTGSHH